MSRNKTRTETDRLNQRIAEARRERARREKTYRERALKMFPWICARCGREFSGKRLRELTVHHKDHNHDNNPPDGSNWELLCVYCHDNEHSRYLDEEWYDKGAPGGEHEPPSTYRPFAGLEALLKDKKRKGR
jgi:5-methylcytosine-specific restriction endonuclease McrA